MQFYSHIEKLPTRGTAVAMGYFDGVHIGHKAVIEAATSYAAGRGLDAAVFTFSLPAKNGIKGSRLLTDADKHTRVEQLGVRYYLEPAFEEFRDLSPEAFVREMLAEAYGAKAVFCGDNFTFGQKAAGNVEMLKALCAPLGIKVCIVPMAQYAGETVSSSRIRAALEEGRVEDANAMLGQAYSINFGVVHGAGLGHTLGIPTINQHFPAGFLLPKFGFYITRVYLDGEWRPAATGLGSRPTVNSDETNITCETFVPDYSGNAYGQTPRLEFHHFLRPTQKFGSLDALRDSVVEAGEEAKRFFSAK